MLQAFNRMREIICCASRLFYVRLLQSANKLLALCGMLVLAAGIVSLTVAGDGPGPLGSWSEAGFDDELIRSSVGNLFRLLEGAFGALIMVVAGLMAIVAAAMGGYRAALGMLIVAVGAFILRSLVSLFFGTDFEGYGE